MLPERVALLGGGVIGAGWAARFVLHGVDVAVCDPDPGAPARVAATVARARVAYRALDLLPSDRDGRVAHVDRVEEAVDGAGFVQESAPERLDLKHELLRRAAAAASPETIIASSTSGLRPSEFQAGCRGPERILVGHPFNPVYLLPLVEICGGRATAPSAIETARSVYEALGMRPLVLRSEIDGFIADRLMEALWREALWLVNDGVATVEEIDDAVRFGAGLRWAFMGTFLTYRIAGGEAGMRHFMAQFGPALAWPWSRLTDVPELTDDLLDRIVAQSDDQADGRSLAELEDIRDTCLVEIMSALERAGFGAGTVLAAQRDRLRQR